MKIPVVTRKSRSLLVVVPLLVALVAFSSLFNLRTGASFAASHREAPAISQDPIADHTDVFAFVSPDQPDTVTLVANFFPGEDPAGFPFFYGFGDDVVYDINIDLNADALPDVVYRFDFSTQFTDPNGLAYNSGVIDTLDSPNLNKQQFYSISELRIDAATELASGLQVPPANVGENSIPDYEALVDAATYEVGDLQVFAGQRDDPFFIDIGSLGDLLTIRVPPGNNDCGINGLAGFNVQTIAVQVPIASLSASGAAPTGADDPNAIIGVWSSSSRFSTTVIAADGTRTGQGDLVQVSRMGNPLVNELAVAVQDKDVFNGSVPADDAQFLDYVTTPILPGLINAIYGIDVPAGDRQDLVQVFLTGVPGLNQPANVAPSEMIRLNMAIPPAASPNPLGVIGGDTAGYPNGRRLGDDVVDISLRVMAGVLVGPEFDVAPNNVLGDGVNGNDLPFLASFPYVAAPHSGFEHEHHLGGVDDLPGCEATTVASPVASPVAGSPTVAATVAATVDASATVAETVP
ncbi:MAG: DUF4331 domain-containing protein, partial [Chloroflexota bacterium]|nr:DUF4331 domain-containing protein [Chloroflexota bacterium]